MLTEKQQKFINSLYEFGMKNGVKAVEIAYPECKKENRSQMLYDLLKKPHIKRAIEEKNYTELEDGISLAISKLKELATNKNNKFPPSVVLSACNSILDRNSISGVARSEVINKVEHLSEQELESQLNSILSQLGIDKTSITH